MIFMTKVYFVNPIPMTRNGLIYKCRIILIRAFLVTISLMFKPSPNLRFEQKIRNSSSDDVDIRVFYELRKTSAATE